MITLRLPLPTPVNDNYTYGANHPRLSDATKTFRELVGWACREQNIEPLTGDVIVSVHVYMNRKRDLDSGVKALFDALNGQAWVDDKQVRAFHFFHCEDFTGDPYVVVQIASKKA